MKNLATGMIRLDHTHVMTMFHRYTPDTSPKTKLGLVTQVCIALDVHAQLEEEIFYPALQEAGIDVDIAGKNVPEHDEMRRHIESLRAMEPTDEAYDATFMDLMRVVIHHVADEETTMVADAERLIPHEQLSEIGKRMTRRRIELTKPYAGQIARSFGDIASTRTKLLAGGALLAGTYLAGRAISQRMGSSGPR